MKPSRKYQNVALAIFAAFGAAIWYSTEDAEGFITLVTGSMLGLLLILPFVAIYLDRKADKKRLG